MSIDFTFDGSTRPGTVIIDVDGLRFRARFDEDAEAHEVFYALVALRNERDRARSEMQRVRELVARLHDEVKL